ncbi:MAG: GGDEF domain-containing protein [Xanthomonadales bacterium]|nr:GGDEF domain-containing protein [Xanthomonadales bacterium]
MGSAIGETVKRDVLWRCLDLAFAVNGRWLMRGLRVLAATLLLLRAGIALGAPELRVERIDFERFDRTPAVLRELAGAEWTSATVDPLQLRVERGEARVWRVRLEATLQVPKPWLLSIHNSFDSDVEVFFPPDYVGERHNLLRSTKGSEHSRFALALNVPQNLKAGDTFFIHVPSPKAASLELRLRDRVEYARHDLNLVRVHSVVVSVMLSCCAVAMCFFFVLREKVWLLFVGYTLASIAFVMSRTGELIAITGFVGLDRYLWQMATIFALLQAGILCFFAGEFARLRDATPKLNDGLRILGVILLLLGMLALLPGVSTSKWLPGIANTLAMLTIPISVVACWLSGRRGERAAWFYLGSTLPSSAGFILLVTHLNGEIRGGSMWVMLVFLAGHALAAITLTAGMADQVLSYRKQRDLALEDANRDPLTGAWNRRAFDRMLQSLIHRTTLDHPCTLCFLDLDYFKRVNDRFGHAIGDDALRFLVREVAFELRGGASIARLGGEEFAVVLPDTNLSAGLRIAERIRKRIEDHGKVISAQALDLTVSIGVATASDPNQAPQALMADADLALYQAKSMGRNRVATTNAAPTAQQTAQGAS